MKHVIASSLIAALALPLTLILTFVLSPLWSWCEATYGIESMGHSGPATWCFIAVYVVVVSLGLVAWFIVQHRTS